MQRVVTAAKNGNVDASSGFNESLDQNMTIHCVMQRSPPIHILFINFNAWDSDQIYRGVDACISRSQLQGR
jgi:hypothetical protein